MAYLGRQSGTIGNYIRCNALTTDGSTTTFALTNVLDNTAVFPGTENTVICSVSGVIQAPGSGNAFTISGSNITFTAAPTAADTIDFILVLGTTVDIGTPSDGTVTNAKLAGSISNDKLAGSISNDKLAGSIANAKLANSSITINGSAVSLGGSVTVGETKPTITSTSLIIAPSTATSVTIAGTNFASSSTVVPIVEAINSTGGVTRASVVSWSSATSISATFNLALGDYRVRVENPDGNAVVSTNAILQASSAPTWTTSAGSLGSNANASAISYTVAATSDSAVTYAKTSGTFPGGVSLNTSTGVISGTESGSSSTTTYTFQITPTDAETQAGPAREFTITISHGISGGGQFNG